MERSLYLGDAIGNALNIAWEGLGSLGAWLRRLAPRAAPRPGEPPASVIAR